VWHQGAPKGFKEGIGAPHRFLRNWFQNLVGKVFGLGKGRIGGAGGDYWREARFNWGGLLN